MNNLKNFRVPYFLVLLLTESAYVEKVLKVCIHHAVNYNYLLLTDLIQ